jgi:hypothetical protein
MSLLDAVRGMAVTRLNMPVWFPLEPGQWELLWGLASVGSFEVAEPLRTYVDETLLAYEFYRLIWELRFLTTENLNLSKAQEVARAIARWLSAEPLSEGERSIFLDIGLRGLPLTEGQQRDLLCMLVTLAIQNSLIEKALP